MAGNIQKKLYRFIALVAVVYLIIINIALFVSISKSVLENVSQRQVDISQKVLDDIDRSIYEKLTDLQIFARIVSTEQGTTSINEEDEEEKIEEISSFLEDIVLLNQFWEKIYFVDSAGVIRISHEESDIGVKMADDAVRREAFSRVMSGSIFYSDLKELSLLGDKKGMLLAVPVYTEDAKVNGALFGYIDREQIASFLKGPSETLHLYNKDGLLLISGDGEGGSLQNAHELEGSILREDSSIQFNLTNTENANEAHLNLEFWSEGRSHALYTHVAEGGYQTYAGNDWTLTSEISFMEALAPGAKASTVVSILTLLLLIIALGVLFYLLRKNIARPIEDLATEISQINVENKKQYITVNREDEIGVLATAFNRLLAKLREYHGTLKKKVYERTSDLEKFRLAVENASDHIIITDSEGIVLYANKAAETITGFSREEMLGKKAGTNELWGGLMPESFYKRMWKTIKQEKKVFQGEINNRRKNGYGYIALASISPITNEEGNIKFFVGIERDITKEKEVDRAKTEFVSLASHQLRTPLTVSSWYAELLLDEDAGKLKPEQKEYVQMIYQSNSRLIDLVNALLNVSRIELGTFVIDPKPTDILAIAQEIIQELQIQIDNKEIDFTAEFDKTLPPIKADPNLFRIVLQNLLTNAIKYTPKGGKITFTVKKTDTDVYISVADNGYGIPSHQQDKIFKKLFRADNVQSKEVDGNGLGLYLVKAIMDNCGGKVWFESEENKGTTFHVSCPLSGMKRKKGSRLLSRAELSRRQLKPGKGVDVKPPKESASKSVQKKNGKGESEDK